MATVQLPATGIAQRRPAGILAYGARQAMMLALPPDARGLALASDAEGRDHAVAQPVSQPSGLTGARGALLPPT
jgi:hypothetical protein